MGSCRRDPGARARVDRAPINAGRESPAMTRGRLAASSQTTLVADKALHPIRKIQPQLIRCSPPNHVQSSRCDGSHRRRKHASTMTGDAIARHRQPHRRREHASATDTSPDDAGTGPRATRCGATFQANREGQPVLKLVVSSWEKPPNARCASPSPRTWARQVAGGPDNPHLGPLMRTLTR